MTKDNKDDRTMQTLIIATIIMMATGFLLFTAQGCGKQSESHKEMTTMTPTTTTAPVLPHTVTDSEVGLKTKCPVTNDPVTVDKNTPALEYKGKVYYFCCNNCPELFKKNPDKYAGK